jgi:hypothetical protein
MQWFAACEPMRPHPRIYPWLMPQTAAPQPSPPMTTMMMISSPLQGPTTTLVSAVLQPIATTAVTPSNCYDHNKFDLGSDDEAVGPSAATPATTPVLTYQDIQRAVNETFKLIIKDIRQNKIDHRRRLTKNFHAYTSDNTTQHWNFEAHHSSFFKGIRQIAGSQADSWADGRLLHYQLRGS